MIRDHVDHEVHAFIMDCLRQSKQIAFGPEISVYFGDILSPISMISAVRLQVFHDGRYPDLSFVRQSIQYPRAGNVGDLLQKNPCPGYNPAC